MASEALISGQIFLETHSPVISPGVYLAPSLSRVRSRELGALAGLLAALVVALTAAILVFGWLLDVEFMRRFHPTLPGMAISTAVGTFAAGLYLLGQSLAPHRTGLARLRQPLGMALLALGLANLVVLMITPGRGLDQILFEFSDSRGGNYMSPATSVCFALAGLCLMVSRRKGVFLSGRAYAILGSVGLIISMLDLIGYAFDSRALGEVFVFTAMAPQTAFVFLLVFVVLLLLRPNWSWVGAVVGPGPGGVTLRRMLPFAVFGPVAFCWLTLYAVEADVFNANFRLSVLAIASAACLVALLFWSVARQNADARKLVASNRRLRQALQERDVLLREVYHRVKNNLQLIDAMLALEARNYSEGEDPDRLAGIRARIHAISLVHQQLIGARNLAEVNLHDFLEELCANQAQGAGFDVRGIRLETRFDDVAADLNHAVPIGLMVAELLSNAAKHAFPDGRGGVVSVVAERGADNILVLSVGDDGVGRSGSGEARESVGEMILRSMASQLAATMEIEDHDGFRVVLRIPLNEEGRD